MINITITFTELDKVFSSKNRAYTEKAWTRALDAIEGDRIPIKLNGSDAFPIGYAHVKEFNWPSVTFEGVFGDYQFDTVIKGEPTFCGIGLCEYESKTGINYVHKFTIDSLVITSKSDMTFDWSIRPESVVRCKRCKNFMETFNYFVKYKGDDYCENCFFEVAIDELKAEQWKTDSRGKPYKLYDNEVDE